MLMPRVVNPLLLIIMACLGQSANSTSFFVQPRNFNIVELASQDNPAIIDSSPKLNVDSTITVIKSEADKEILEINEEQNGGMIAMVVNDTVRIQIEGNPTTGFTWESEKLDTDLLKPMGEPKFISNSNLKGGEGVFTFTFKSLKPSVTHLRLLYHRTFEKDTPPARIFDVVVDIQP